MGLATPETDVDGVTSDERVDVLLVCTSGGHLLELFALRGASQGAGSSLRASFTNRVRRIRARNA